MALLLGEQRTAFDYDFVWEFPLDMIDVPAFQRTVIKSFVKEVVADFKPRVFGAVTLAPTGGGRANLCDGLQRVTALEKLAFEAAPAFVLPPGLSYQEQAQIFLDLDHRRKLKAYDRYHTALAAELPWALGLRDGSAATGWRIVSGDASGKKKEKGAFVLLCVANLKLIYDYGGRRLLERTLKTLTEWLEGGPADGALVLGLGNFIRHAGGDFDEARFRRLLRQVDVEDARKMVTEMRKGRGGGGQGGRGQGDWQRVFALVDAGKWQKRKR